MYTFLLFAHIMTSHHPRTLIAFAAHRGNDAVVAALLRAGADPAQRVKVSRPPQSALVHPDATAVALEKNGEVVVRGEKVIVAACVGSSGVVEGADEEDEAVDPAGAAVHVSTPGVREHLAGLRRPHAVWLVRHAVTLRRLGELGANRMCEVRSSSLYSSQPRL
jgi:hypothetical protein